MIIPDQSHINRIREALWQLPESFASVMVGAGFSCNARKARPSTRLFPRWQDIAQSLCKKLYPSGDGNRLKRAIAEASGTSGFLRVAQEYEAAFGRTALHNLIKELVPDDDYVPDEIHIRLLQLPWRDIFTTNWDTLLERTRSVVAERAYGVVLTQEEIPSTRRPRIVKLHGSFPAHIPFIFTEEDYRTYPKRFAPYVNTVQQAMMETVFCLIGFSGDDPNFLHWTGWVRDNLGQLAPKIYLAGWLDLSSHRRRMLEERNVVPIDVAHHPQASQWSDHLRHRYATQWILHTLERGRPYDKAEWPSKRNRTHPPIPEIVQPVEDITVDSPMEEPQPPSPGAGSANLAEQVRAVVHAWKHNRKIYPGWLFIPPIKHALIEMFMRNWERTILQIAPVLPPIERFAAIRELVWRRDNLLEPLSKQLEDATQAVLDDIECQTKKIGGIEDQSIPWTDVRAAWRELALTLLTAARQRLDRITFDRRLTALRPFLDDHPDVRQRVFYEECLWATYSLNFVALDKLVKEWDVEGCDPIWMSRKAAIMVEMDRNDEAIRLLNRSLSTLREAPYSDLTFESPSREGWILWLALAFEHDYSRSLTETMDVPPVFSRWRQLSDIECNAFDQKRDLLKELQGAPEKKDAPLFDLGVRRGRTITYSDAEYKKRIVAHRAVRLSEVAGLPPSASDMVVASDLMALAAEHLVKTDCALATRLALRVSHSEDDAVFNRVWTRSRIAIMPMEDVTALVDLVAAVISYALPRVTNSGERSVFWVTKLRVAIEALSRLVLRLPVERAEHIFKQSLNYYQMKELARQLWLSKPMKHMLTRAWEALPKSHQTNLILDILSAPIVGIDGLEASQFYPDPGDRLTNLDSSLMPQRLPENERRWSEIVHIITRGLGCPGEARKRAAHRLMILTLWGRLMDSERNLAAQALWNTYHTDQNSLPSGTSLYDWTFFLLPEPRPGLAEQLFREKWLGPQGPTSEKDINELFQQLGMAIVSLRKHHRPLSLSGEERATLATKVENWITYPIVNADHDPFDSKGTNKGLIGLQFILREIDLSSSVAEALFAKVMALNQSNTPGFRLFNCIAKFLPARLNEITMSMRVGLASDNTDQAEEAVLGLHVWLIAALEEASSIPSPPDDLLQEIGVMIATRRKNVLIGALQVARWIFSSGSAKQRDTIAQSTLHGLRYLIEELRYDRDHDDEGDLEIPVLRWGCVHLALAMSAAGYQTDPTVMRWAEAAQDDPLPEVRLAEGPASVRSGECKPGINSQ